MSWQNIVKRKPKYGKSGGHRYTVPKRDDGELDWDKAKVERMPDIVSSKNISSSSSQEDNFLDSGQRDDIAECARKLEGLLEHDDNFSASMPQESVNKLMSALTDMMIELDTMVD